MQGQSKEDAPKAGQRKHHLLCASQILGEYETGVGTNKQTPGFAAAHTQGLCVLAGLPHITHIPALLLPCPLQARLLYHEAAVLEAQQLSSGASNSTGGSGTCSKPSEPRLQLLREALEYAKQATQLNPNSLSSAALRATLVVNVLVEESSLFSGSAASAISGIAGSSSSSSKGSTSSSSTSSAERIKQEFRDAMAACSRAANTTTPTMAEPVVNINDGGSQTCDPCSLVRPKPLGPAQQGLTELAL